MTKVQKLHVPEKVEEDFVVVIDVIRAFTTAAYAFDRGATKIILVSTVEEAFKLKEDHPEYLLMGEVGGRHIEGFDYSNSPFEISKADLRGTTLVQRTTAGTQGVTRSIGSEKILVASFVVARASIKRILKIAPELVTLVITDERDSDEDRALADYFEEGLLSDIPDARKYLERVIDSISGQELLNPELTHCPKEDLDAVLEIDKFPFAMEIFMEEGLPVLKAVNSDGSLFKPIDYEKMTAPCGLPCFNCVVHLASEDEEIRKRVAKQFGVPEEQVKCDGCRAVEGWCPVMSEQCKGYLCSKKKGVKFCYECPDFPCDYLQPYADKADSLPHNTKLFHLCLIKKMGLEYWATTKAKEVKEEYFYGKWEF